MAKELTKRDKWAKQLLIEYLEQDTDERLWQAVNNFGKLYGLTSHFLVTSQTIPGDATDLWFQESDKILEDIRREIEANIKNGDKDGKEKGC